jgi:hypothetical protein
VTGAYPQPHEGITGTDRGDSWLLSLDWAAQPHRNALIAMARHLRTATMVGQPAPIVADMYERITHPQVGDLVVETSTGMHSQDPKISTPGLGYLLARRTEWAHIDAEWAQVADEYGDERPTDLVWYVQYGPKPTDVFRWHNAGFLAVPIDVASF